MNSIVIFSPAVFQGYGHEFDYTTGLACGLKSAGTLELHVVGFDGPFKSRLPGGLIPHTLRLESVTTSKGSSFSRQVKWGIRRIGQSKKLLNVAVEVANTLNARGILFESFEYYTLARSLRRFHSPIRSVFHDTSFSARQTSLPASLYKAAMARSAASIVAGCERTFVHGEAMKENLVRNLRLDQDLADRVLPISYGAPAPSPADQVDRSTALRTLHIEDDGRPVLLAFGTLRRDKEFPLLLGALSEASCWRLLIAGPEGDMTFAEIETQAHRLGIADRVTLMRGFIPKAEQPIYFGAADAIAGIYAPSIRHESGTCQLARAYLKPIVASGPPDLEDYVRKTGVGWTPRTHTPESLSETLAEVDSASEDQKLAMRRRIEACALERSWPRVCQDVFQDWF